MWSAEGHGGYAVSTGAIAVVICGITDADDNIDGLCFIGEQSCVTES